MYEIRSYVIFVFYQFNSVVSGIDGCNQYFINQINHFHVSTEFYAELFPYQAEGCVLNPGFTSRIIMLAGTTGLMMIKPVLLRIVYPAHIENILRIFH